MNPDPTIGTERKRSKRVGRPRRLTTPAVVDAAIELADDRSLEELSMPSLAKHLGVGTMTLYGYVENKEDLLDRMAVRLFEDVHVTAHEGWREGMFAFFARFREAAIAHPTLAGLLANGRISIPAVFDILEGFFQEATDAGVEIDEAVRVFYAALTYTIGFVLWEIPRAHLQPESDYGDQWAGLLAGLDPTEFSLLTGPASRIVPTVASTSQFDWGLLRVIG